MFDDTDTPPASPDRPERGTDSTPGTPPAADQPEESSPSETKADPARARFLACRFHAEDDGEEYCSNRDVLPYAGKHGFNAEAWCPDCDLYKLRRTPKRRSRDAAEDDDYPY